MLPAPASAAAPQRQFIRDVYAVLQHVAAHPDTRTEYGRVRLAVLLALLAHAHEAGSRIVQPSVRTLGMSAGLLSGRAVVGVLAAERRDPHGWARLHRRPGGARADLYEILLPNRYAHLAGRVPAAGEPRAVHSIFATGVLAPGVGLAAWQVERAVTTGARTTAQIAEITGICAYHVRTCTRALQRAGLVVRSRPGGLCRTSTSLDAAGDNLGVPLVVAQYIERCEADRRRWREGLTRFWQPPPPRRP